MEVVRYEIVQHKVVLIKLSCGVSFSLKVDIDYDDFSDETVTTYLTKIIENISYYDDEGIFDVYETTFENGQSRWGRKFSVDSTPELLKLIKYNNDGGAATCHSIGTTDKVIIKQFIKEII
jgi:hypothetical protein